MEFKANFKSIVAIGGFNPTILTPDFLREHCSFKSDLKPSGQTTPVVTNIKYGNIELSMELNRFQIRVNDIEDFDDQYPLEVMVTYLEVLKYTPVSLFGINFNYSLSGINKPALVELLKEPLQIGERLNVAPTLVSLEAKKPNGSGLALTEVTINHLVEDRLKNSVRIAFGSDDVTINKNFEVGDLDTDRSRIHILLRSYDGLVKSNRDFITRIEEL